MGPEPFHTEQSSLFLDHRIHDGAHVYSRIYNHNHKPDIPSYIYIAWNNQMFPQKERKNTCITVTTVFCVFVCMCVCVYIYIYV